MIKTRELAGGQGMPDSLDTMAAVRSEGTGIPFAMPQPQGMLPPAMAQGTGIPPEMPQPAPAMAQGTGIPQAMTQAMRPSGLAGIARSPEAPESNMIINALKTLDKRGNKETTYKKLARAAEDRGMTLPSADSGLMRLAAEGGPVLYRREGGVSSGSSREETLAKLQAVVDRYGAFVPKIGEPLDYFSNNPLVGFSGGGEEGGTPYNELYIRDTDGPGGILSLSGRGTDRNFEREYQALASQLNAPEPEVESTDFVPLSDTRYGSLNDPNLPAMDAAQQRLQYRQNVGFYDKPPGPTANTNRILAQAYGEESPIYQEILQGLQPTPTQPVSTETAMQAYYGLPGVVYDPEKEVEAQTGGGLKDLASGGEFSGRVPGDGGGMEDNVRMPIMEGEEQVATLAVSPTEYVVDSYTMAALGNGNPDKGADYMDEVVEDIREEAYGTTQQPNEIDGLALLQANMMG